MSLQDRFHLHRPIKPHVPGIDHSDLVVADVEHAVAFRWENCPVAPV
ncbi:hypothetical protein [Pseudonocardia yunnanensis]|uniref:Uncharacterized protein n=1 Tax=Pseudonocardia yunnanensis TaxID=58107 RepID=A0ABW4FAV2_9PSEU